MIRNKWKGRWEAKSPNDLIGWDILNDRFDEDMNCFILTVVSRGNGEQRTVYATQMAVPLWMIEKSHK